ncbi:hypothetical protein BG004_000366 [Podila humilis]|nr:hypothetical protein BG004_000366 [Podila humilis]
MGSDLRTPAKDLLALAKKVSAANLRERVWERSKSLSDALNHVEDIEDEDEPRILRESMEPLQIAVREALLIASVSDVKGLTAEQHNRQVTAATTGPSTTAIPTKQYRVPDAFISTPASTTVMAPGTPPSVHRHPLGLFSTSPKFTAHSPFGSPARPAAASRLSTTAAAPLSPLSASPLSLSSPASTPVSPPTSPPTFQLPSSKPGGISATIVASKFTTVTDGPLSIAMDPTPVQKSRVTRSAYLHSVATSSSVPSSVASSSSPITLQDKSFTHTQNQASSPSKLKDSENSTHHKDQIMALGAKKTTPTNGTQSTQPRRVPRGLFSTSSVPSTSSSSGVDPQSSRPTKPVRVNGSQDANGSDQPIEVAPVPVPSHSKLQNVAIAALENTTLTTPLSSPLSMDKIPTSSCPLQRAHPKPTPIETSPRETNHGTKATTASHQSRTLQNGDDGDERISQLVRDLENAMNPTPTEPVPQPYFLQGKGLLERIPSQVSMDDGLLDDHAERQNSEIIQTSMKLKEEEEEDLAGLDPYKDDDREGRGSSEFDPDLEHDRSVRVKDLCFYRLK